MVRRLTIQPLFKRANTHFPEAIPQDWKLRGTQLETEIIASIVFNADFHTSCLLDAVTRHSYLRIVQCSAQP